MNEQLRARVRDHRLFVFLERLDYTEAEILEGIRASTSLGALLDEFELVHPAIPGRAHPVVRIPQAYADFTELRQLLLEAE